MGRYTVSGKDEEGDTWTFSTDRRERAEEFYGQFKEDMNAVTFEEEKARAEAR